MGIGTVVVVVVWDVLLVVVVAFDWMCEWNCEVLTVMMLFC
jgi:hypothetical protein